MLASDSELEVEHGVAQGEAGTLTTTAATGTIKAPWKPTSCAFTGTASVDMGIIAMGMDGMGGRRLMMSDRIGMAD